MKFFLLFIAALCQVVNVAAYAGPGAYERLWYYYAYLVDTSDGREATKIAVNCATNMETGGRPCTFNEFIKYIDSAPEKTKATRDYSVTDDRVPDVERTANMLVQKELTGPYDNTKIRAKVKEKDGRGVAKVMSEITDFLLGKVGDASQEIKLGLQQATVGTARTRMAASVASIAEIMQRDHDVDVRRRQIPLFRNPPADAPANSPAGPMADDVDVPATIANNPGTTARGLVDMMKGAQDKNHKTNIDEARRGATQVHFACR